MDDDTKFWIVYGQDPKEPYAEPVILRHTTYERAVAEAEKFARDYEGGKFYVLETTGYFEVEAYTPPVKYTPTVERHYFGQ